MPPKKRATNSEAGLKMKLVTPKAPKRKKKPLLLTEKNVLPLKPKRTKNSPNLNPKKSRSPTMNGRPHRKRKTNLNSTSENLVKVKMATDGVA